MTIDETTSYRRHREDLANSAEITLRDGLSSERKCSVGDVEEVDVVDRRNSNEIRLLRVPLHRMKRFDVALWVDAEHHSSTA